MRPITSFVLHAFAAAVLTALAATSAAAAAADYFLKLGNVAGASKNSGRERIEVESFHWGAVQAAGNVEFEWKVEEGESAPPPPGAGKFGAVGGAHRNDDITSPRDSASGQANRARTYASPLDRGSVRVKVKFPWLDCRVGAAFPDAVLQNDAGRFELKDVQVTGCARDGVALNYKKVTVRGWNPEKKEE